MSVVSDGHDIISTLPVWQQVAANFGIFIVAVVAAAFGFFRRHSPAFSNEHFIEGGKLETFGDDVKSIASSLRDMRDMMQTHAQNEVIEREVQRRLTEERKGRPQNREGGSHDRP